MGNLVTLSYSISDLAKEFGITTRTIRYYEDHRLLSPSRRGRTRIYDQRDHTRLKLVLRGKRLGFSLKVIEEVLDMYDAEPGEVGQLNYLLEKIIHRRAQMEQQQKDIENSISDLIALENQCNKHLKSLT